MKFLISTSYNTSGRSVIWKLDTESLKLEIFREDYFSRADYLRTHYSYTPRVRIKDYIYFGMGIYEENLFCVGGNTLTILDLNGNLLRREQVDILKDAHDLQIIDGQIFCTNTGHDTIEIFSTNLEHKKTIRLRDFSHFHGKKLLPRKKEYYVDSLHANCISSCNGNIWVTHFFTCERNWFRAIRLTYRFLRGLIEQQPFQHKGFVVNLLSGKILSSGGVISLQGNPVIHQFYGPHDGLFYKEDFYINSTHNVETHIYDKNFKLRQRIQYDTGMFLRGLSPIDNRTFLVGAGRIDPARTAAFMYKLVLKGRRKRIQFDQASSVKIIDRETHNIVESIYFEEFQGIHPEIYQIIPFESC